MTTRRQVDRQATDRIDVGAQRLGQAHHDIEAAITFEQRTGPAAADRRSDHILNVHHAESVACCLLTIDIDRQHRQASGLLDLDFRCARHMLQPRGDVIRQPVHVIHVVTEYLDRDIAAHARDQLIETQLDRLREIIVVAGDLPHRIADGLQQLVARLAWLRPLVDGLEHDVTIGQAGRHRVGRNLGGADAGEHALDLGELLFQRGLDQLLHLDRLGQAHAGCTDGLHRKIAFVQVGHELGTEPRHQQRTQYHQHSGRRQYDRLHRHDLVVQRQIPAPRGTHQHVFFFFDATMDEQRHRRRYEGH